MTSAAQREGTLPVPGGNVFYRIAGDGPGIPLLVLHGGPGAGHDYLEPLAAIGADRPVVFYDQLGCGRSDIPDDNALWQLDRFVAELDAVRKGLGLDRIHLLGHSWGGFLAIEYMLTRPTGVVSLVLGSTAASAQGFARAARSLVAGLPQDVREAIDRCEAEGATDSPEYQAATMAFFAEHVCRLPQPWPDYVMRTMANVMATPTYAVMWGPSEFNVSGNLRDWDRVCRLGEITTPTLITSGRYDEATPALAAELANGIPGSRSLLFENSAHMAHLEETEAFIAAVRDFLKRSETPA